MTRRAEHRIDLLPMLDIFPDPNSEPSRIWRRYIGQLNRTLQIVQVALGQKAVADQQFFILPLAASESGATDKVYGPVPFKHRIIGGSIGCFGTMPTSGVTMEVTWSADGLYSTTKAVTVVAPVTPETRLKDLKIVSTGALVEKNSTYAVNTAGGTVNEPRIVLIYRIEE